MLKIDHLTNYYFFGSFKYMINKFLLLLFCLALSSCDLSQSTSNTEPPLIEDEKDTDNLSIKVKSKPAVNEPRNQPSTRVQTGQNRLKSFEDAQSRLIKGKPRHPFPSENILE